MPKNISAVRRWGNSRAVVISQRVQEQLTWALREVVHVSVEDDAIVLRPLQLPPRVVRAQRPKPGLEAA